MGSPREMPFSRRRTVRRPARPSLSWRLPLPTQDAFLSSPHCSPACEAKFILAIAPPAPPHARCLSLVAALFADLRGQVYLDDCPSPRKMPFSRRRTVRRPARPSLSWRLPPPPLHTQDVFLSSPHCSPTCEAKFILTIAPP